mmetsp:Transcript_8920/g.26793  ORF Transcript_8920/g.26793 Transcript_8920/m.26793 type:complete len:468 (+) Transcript_8920:205-1608(+)
MVVAEAEETLDVREKAPLLAEYDEAVILNEMAEQTVEDQEKEDEEDSDDVVGKQELQPMKLAMVITSLFLLMFSLSMLIPVLPSLLLNIVGNSSSRAAYISGILGILTMPLELFLHPYLGALSDKVGRRPVLLIGLFGFAVEMALLAIYRNLPIYILTRFVATIGGVFPTTAHACIADLVVGTGKEPVYFGIVGFTGGLSFAIAPTFGGMLVARYDEQAALWASVFLSLVNMLFIALVLPETAKRRRKKPVNFEVLNFTKLFTKTRTLSALVLVQFFVNFTTVWHSISYLYFHEVLGWNAGNMGTFVSVAGICSMVNQGIMTRVVLKLIGEFPALKLGFISEMGYLLMVALTKQPWQAYTALVIGSLGWISMPTLRAIVARQVPPSQQGSLQGSLAAMNTLQSGLGSLLMSVLFGLFSMKGGGLPYVPNAPFTFIIVNMFIATVFLVRAESIIKEENVDAQLATSAK